MNNVVSTVAKDHDAALQWRRTKVTGHFVMVATENRRCARGPHRGGRGPARVRARGSRAVVALRLWVRWFVGSRSGDLVGLGRGDSAGPAGAGHRAVRHVQSEGVVRRFGRSGGGGSSGSSMTFLTFFEFEGLFGDF